MVFVLIFFFFESRVDRATSVSKVYGKMVWPCRCCQNVNNHLNNYSSVSFCLKVSKLCFIVNAQDISLDTGIVSVQHILNAIAAN